MILVENREVLRNKNRDLLTAMAAFEKKQTIENQVIVEQARKGGLTLKIAVGDKMQYIHSKYDPVKDAQRLTEAIEMEQAQQVLFIGIGLGYHIQQFIERYPSVKFSIYEPCEAVLYAYLSNVKLPMENLETIFTGTNLDGLDIAMEKLLISAKGKLKVVALPVYEKIYDKEIATIQKKVVEALKYKKSALVVNVSFQKRWTINAIKNFPTVLNTPNILHDVDKDAFKGKPAIIVAAGPSLNEEFENLRYIKENGLAYIFSVGSAINALIEYGIYPDAACTYDPQDINYRVIQIIKDKKLTDIPLVFGSSVGFETIEDYPGHMLHMLVSQDTVAPAFLGENLVTDLDYVNDAPSIAVVTYQLLSQLGCGEIILVGQNLAYVGDEHYASGIDYGSGTKAKKEHFEKAVLTKDVYGNEVKTNNGFNAMRQQLEMYIKKYPQIKTINTTKGGAAIQGTNFKTLEELLQEELTIATVIDRWYDVENAYDHKKIGRNLLSMDEEQVKLEKLLKRSMELLEQLSRRIDRRILHNIESFYGKFDVSIENVKANHFYRSFIEPMIRVQNEQLAETISSVRYERNEQRKGDVVVPAFHSFLQEISVNYYFAVEVYEEMRRKITV